MNAKSKVKGKDGVRSNVAARGTACLEADKLIEEGQS